MPIGITDRAVKEVRRIVTDQNLPSETALRVGVKGGGCSGFSYTLGFDDQLKATDQINEVEGVRVICDPKSFLYLNDAADHLHSIERINLGNHNNTIGLSAQDVIDISGNDFLFVDGGATDRVSATSGWTYEGTIADGGNIYHHYSMAVGAATAHLAVDTDIALNT